MKCLVCFDEIVLKCCFIISGRHYVAVIFSGATLCQMSALLFLNLPLDSSACQFLMFLSGLSPTMIFAAIFIKTRRIYKIFIKTFESHR